MTALTDADLRLMASDLFAAIKAEPGYSVLDPAVWSDAAEWYADALAPSVEAIVQRAVNAALTEAADAISDKAAMFREAASDMPDAMASVANRHRTRASGLNQAARIVRARTT